MDPVKIVQMLKENDSMSEVMLMYALRVHQLIQHDNKFQSQCSIHQKGNSGDKYNQYMATE